MTDSRLTSLDNYIRDKRGKITLWQSPNMALWVWIVARMAEWPLSGGAHTVAMTVAFVALALWAVMELTDGVNYFRRALGFVVLAMSILSAV